MLITSPFSQPADLDFALTIHPTLHFLIVPNQPRIPSTLFILDGTSSAFSFTFTPTLLDLHNYERETLGSIYGDLENLLTFPYDLQCRSGGGRLLLDGKDQSLSMVVSLGHRQFGAVVNDLDWDRFGKRAERCRQCLESLFVGYGIRITFVVLVGAKVRAEPVCQIRRRKSGRKEPT